MVADIKCKLKGICKNNWVEKIPCAFPNGTSPDSPSPELKSDMDAFCPQQFDSICCSSDQFYTLREQFGKLKPFIKNCPACIRNFKTLLCGTSCGDQSVFNLTEWSTDKSPYVINSTLSINDQFGSTLFNSCKNITLSASGTPILDFIGNSPSNWIDLIAFMGHKSAFTSPFTFIPLNSSNGFNPPGVPCNDPIYGCPCSDCPSTCPSLSITYTNISLFTQVWLYAGFGITALVSLIYILLLLYLKYKPDHITLDESPQLESQSSIEHPVESMSSQHPTLSSSIWYHLQRLSGQYFFLVSVFNKRILSAFAIYCVALTLIASLIQFKFESDPISLWSSPSSQTFKSKVKYDALFDPFYRIQQAILPIKDFNASVSKVYEIVNSVQKMPNYTETCLQINNNCVVYSIAGYGDKSKTKYCLDHPQDCLPPFLMPLTKEMVMINNNYFVMTFPMRNSTVEWELKLLDYFKSVDTLIFSTESSIMDELQHSSSMDIYSILLSYLCMTLYLIYALNVLNFGHKLIIIVTTLLGITSSIAFTFIFFQIVQVYPSFILLEVIPFLILAIGVDYCFILIHTANTPMDTSRHGMHYGPGLLITLLLELIVFLMATLIDTPAIKCFALYASVALFINGITQMLVLPSLISLLQIEQTPLGTDYFLKLVQVVLQYSKPISKSLFVVLGVLTSLMLTIPLGLNQMDILPQHSYLKDYYTTVTQMAVGAPVYMFSTRNYTLQSLYGLCGKRPDCLKDNKMDILTLLTNGTTSPIDDFIEWTDSCCGVPKDTPLHSFYHIPTTPCIPDFFGDCISCNITLNTIEERDIKPLMHAWLQQQTQPTCMSGGKVYEKEITLQSNDFGIAYRYWHKSIVDPNDFIDALQFDLDVSRFMDFNTYSPFHIFFEQYLEIKQLMIFVIALVVVTSALISVLLLGSLKSGIVFVLSQFTLVVLLLNVSHVLGLEMNGILACNLIMTMGVCYEFNSHFIIHYLTAVGSKQERILASYEKMSKIIWRGIGSTKLIGVLALSLSSSVVFQKYYFIFYFWFVLLVLFTGSLN